MTIKISETFKVADVGYEVVRGAGIAWQYSNISITANNANGYIMDTSSGALTLTLPDIIDTDYKIAFRDYARTFGTNNLTIGRNGQKIEGIDEDLIIDISGVMGELVWIDATQGWLLTNINNGITI